MASYLIDFENVGNEGLRGIELLEKEDAVHIFYNEAVSRLTFPMEEKIFRCKAQVRFFAASVGGNNALDFLLGLGISMQKIKRKFIILSAEIRDFYMRQSFGEL